MPPMTEPNSTTTPQLLIRAASTSRRPVTRSTGPAALGLKWT